jgi:hypothetical protein
MLVYIFILLGCIWGVGWAYFEHSKLIGTSSFGRKGVVSHNFIFIIEYFSFNSCFRRKVRPYAQVIDFTRFPTPK